MFKSREIGNEGVTKKMQSLPTQQKCKIGLFKREIIIILKIAKRGQRLMSEKDFKTRTASDIKAG